MNTMLPIGSVVELENDDKKYVIVGFMHQELEGNTLSIYQYTACEYSLGIDDKNDFLYFNDDKIDGLLFMGYTTQFDRIYLRILYEMYKEIENEKNIDKAMDNVLNKHFGNDEAKKSEIKNRVVNNYMNYNEGGNENG